MTSIRPRNLTFDRRTLLKGGAAVAASVALSRTPAQAAEKSTNAVDRVLQEMGEAQLKTIHRLFYSLIDETCAGQYRQEQVIISGSRYPVPAPAKIGGLMKGFCRWLSTQEKILHPVEFAARAHKEFVFIHPFVDGNGRVARLLMNLCLLRQGYTMAIIPPVLRGEYIALLEKAHVDDADFVQFIAERVEETQKDLLRLL